MVHKSFSKEGDIILDPFSGSGTSVRVATNLGRVGIGIEILETYARESAENLGFSICNNALPITCYKAETINVGLKNSSPVYSRACGS